MSRAVGDVLVSGHALARYRERFDPEATFEDVAEAFDRADHAPPWVVKAFEGSTPDGVTLWMHGRVVFAAIGCRVEFGGERGPACVIKTVLPLQWAIQRS